MRAADALIEEIVASSQIPSGKRRREVVRELRSHIDDFVLDARGAGHREDEIERMILANFGDPRQVGRDFAWVYRRERALLRLCVFALSTLAVASLSAVGTLMVQAGVAAGFGIPFLRTLGTRHTIIEAADIFATVAAYVGILSLERLFGRRRFPKAIAGLSLIFAILLGCFAAAGAGAPFLIFGFANAIFLRSVQVMWKAQAARLGAALVCFGLFGVWLWARSPGFQYSVTASLVSWLVMGLGYQVMTGLAMRMDRGLSDRLQGM
jgi:hypothetical protein